MFDNEVNLKMLGKTDEAMTFAEEQERKRMLDAPSAWDELSLGYKSLLKREADILELRISQKKHTIKEKTFEQEYKKQTQSLDTAQASLMKSIDSYIKQFDRKNIDENLGNLNNKIQQRNNIDLPNAQAELDKLEQAVNEQDKDALKKAKDDLQNAREKQEELRLKIQELEFKEYNEAAKKRDDAKKKLDEINELVNDSAKLEASGKTTEDAITQQQNMQLEYDALEAEAKRLKNAPPTETEELKAARNALEEQKKTVGKLENDPILEPEKKRDAQLKKLQDLQDAQKNDLYSVLLWQERQKESERMQSRFLGLKSKLEASTGTFSDLQKKTDLSLEELEDGVKTFRNEYALFSSENAPAPDEYSYLDFKYNPEKYRLYRNISEIIEETFDELPKSDLTASQLTDKIRSVVPGYHLDQSKPAQQKRTELHEKARTALREAVTEVYDLKDPLINAGTKLWSPLVNNKRSNPYYAPYIKNFMGEDAKKELLALGKMADDGLADTREFHDRKIKLHADICRHATSIADGELDRIRKMSTEELVENYHEIHAFFGLSNVMQSSAMTGGPGLTPKETQDFYRTMDPCLSVQFYVNYKIRHLASDFGTKIDLDQIYGLTTEQQKAIETIAVGPAITKNADKGPGPIAQACHDTGNIMADLVSQLSASPDYPQFHREYATDNGSNNIYEEGYSDPGNVYTTLEGKTLDQAEAANEIFQNKRPVLIASKGSDTEPVMLYATGGKALFGPDAAKKFREEQAQPEPKEEPFDPDFETYKVDSPLHLLEYLWNRLCDLVEFAFGWAGANADPVRSEWMKGREKESDSIREMKESHKEKAAEQKKSREASKALVNSDTFAELEENGKEAVRANRKKALDKLQSALDKSQEALSKQFNETCKAKDNQLTEAERTRFAAEAIQYHNIQENLNTAYSNLQNDLTGNHLPTELRDLLHLGNTAPEKESASIQENILKSCSETVEQLNKYSSFHTDMSNLRRMFSGTPEQQMAAVERSASSLTVNKEIYEKIADTVPAVALENMADPLYQLHTAFSRQREELVEKVEQMPEDLGKEEQDAFCRSVASELYVCYNADKTLRDDIKNLEKNGGELSPETKRLFRLNGIGIVENSVELNLDLLRNEAMTLADSPEMKKIQPTPETLRKMLVAGTVDERTEALTEFSKSLTTTKGKLEVAAAAVESKVELEKDEGIKELSDKLEATHFDLETKEQLLFLQTVINEKQTALQNTVSERFAKTNGKLSAEECQDFISEAVEYHGVNRKIQSAIDKSIQNNTATIGDATLRKLLSFNGGSLRERKADAGSLLLKDWQKYSDCRSVPFTPDTVRKLLIDGTPENRKDALDKADTTLRVERNFSQYFDLATLSYISKEDRHALTDAHMAFKNRRVELAEEVRTAISEGKADDEFCRSVAAEVIELQTTDTMLFTEVKSLAEDPNKLGLSNNLQNLIKETSGKGKTPLGYIQKKTNLLKDIPEMKALQPNQETLRKMLLTPGKGATATKDLMTSIDAEREKNKTQDNELANGKKDPKIEDPKIEDPKKVKTGTNSLTKK